MSNTPKPFTTLRPMRCCRQHQHLEVNELPGTNPDAIPIQDTTVVWSGGEVHLRIRGLGWDMHRLCDVLHIQDRAFRRGEASGREQIQRELRALIGAAAAAKEER